MCLSSQLQKDDIKIGYSEGWPGPKVRPYSKITRRKRAGGRAQVIECLANKQEALSSNPSTKKISVV
jgi:hypothetical protein